MPIYRCSDGECSRTFEADSWKDAMDTAADYMSEGEYVDENGTQRIEYTVYQLPASVKTKLGDNVRIDGDMLSCCESRDSTHVVRPTEPECPHGDHDFVSNIEHESGVKENPGTFGHGGAIVCYSHCKHCGLPKTDSFWDNDLDRFVPDGNTSYGEIPDDWPLQEYSDD